MGLSEVEAYSDENEKGLKIVCSKDGKASHHLHVSKCEDGTFKVKMNSNGKVIEDTAQLKARILSSIESSGKKVKSINLNMMEA